jgi:hypothetical protein
MSINGDIHVSDVGTVFLVTIMDSSSPVDLSTGVSASNVILFLKPDRTTFSASATFTTDGTDGKIQYITSSSSILDQSGGWHIGANVNTANGKWTATALPFTVLTTFG